MATLRVPFLNNSEAPRLLPSGDNHDKNCTVDLNWNHLKTVASTNSYLYAMLKAGTASEGAIVVSDYQERGRGQAGNGWESEPGRNLLMSVLLHPAFLSASRQFSLSIATSLAVLDTLQACGVSAWIKWPNDILTSKGKIAGILIENGITGVHLSHSIIGIGLNVNQVRFPDFPLPATSMALEGAVEHDPWKLAGTLAGNLRNRYLQLKEGGTVLQRDAYLERLYRKDVPSLFETPEGDWQGIIRGISEYGELVVEREGSLKAFGMHALRLKVTVPPVY